MGETRFSPGLLDLTSPQAQHPETALLPTLSPREKGFFSSSRGMGNKSKGDYHGQDAKTWPSSGAKPLHTGNGGKIARAMDP